MSNDSKKSKKEISTDKEIRKLVIARLKVISKDTIKCIGDQGSFSRDELIKHVQDDDEVGQTMERVEMEWLRGLKSGLVSVIYNEQELHD
ncbi:MAG: hypothetical protein CO042_01730 [Parcubacteria group bacterium CG_4_9_14_0_2_um_filter_41_8]|nr:MAG: hypothetical protein AUJ34_00760 [Parcubacteria group bacterium CG1_02_41_12]PIQ78509.1 MAG: hypothetical protein COV79_05210 [Parcubacteria group bacterium CG11_big_fil_rev_8_21_14_0_20_41_14]PJC40821.1 MAG: hypothetical protein CO042_01730 [Parcubacteria group bacterium CG_4_9_14_0_2_um_filter_41_8]